MDLLYSLHLSRYHIQRIFLLIDLWYCIGIQFCVRTYSRSWVWIRLRFSPGVKSGVHAAFLLTCWVPHCNSVCRRPCPWYCSDHDTVSQASKAPQFAWLLLTFARKHLKPFQRVEKSGVRRLRCYMWELVAETAIVTIKGNEVRRSMQIGTYGCVSHWFMEEYALLKCQIWLVLAGSTDNYFDFHVYFLLHDCMWLPRYKRWLILPPPPNSVCVCVCVCVYVCVCVR